MKKWIHKIIEDFVREYEKNTVTKWGNPIVGFADAEVVGRELPKFVLSHGVPCEVMDDASVVLAYFVPFLEETAETNTEEGLASREWALAYEETNEMLGNINQYLIGKLREKGYDADVHPESGRFDKDKLISYWSHRHIAYYAGLGTFGLNNMLITEKGCCGRYSTVITNLDVEPDTPRSDELCGYKADGTCGVCMARCPKGALTPEGFDRYKCYEQCLENAAIYTEFGSSYTEEGETTVGSEVCGKCVAGMPCAFR